MKPLLNLLAFAALTLGAGCATIAQTAPSPTYVVRHLNTPEGERDPDLTAEGAAQAERLSDWGFGPSPRAIYVTDFKRTRQTAAPLATRLGLELLVYDPADTPGLVERVRAGPTPALIVGHSNTVPDIVEQLGGARPGPLVHEDFGDLWIVGSDGATRRLRIGAEATVPDAPR
ncbi:SixA phosphatase family protein [Sphingosinicella terrae]|uniref:SixA phosphatase family protein n=1 Tax=Sphingosinicella terrae TaxID=2172047 RepID=UPI000E0DFF1D|nr:phosphoglycerate mutase family protein [Sphingosinicella terrae]